MSLNRDTYPSPTAPPSAATAIRPDAPRPAAPAAVDPRRWQALWVVLIAAFMDILDATVVFLAIPFIQRDLGASGTQVQWTLAGYQLAFAALLITGGRLGDIFGRKRLYLIGVAGFTAASALCGLAQSPELLIAARVLQGALAGLMVPQVLSIIQAGFPPHERGAAFGAFGAVLSLGNVGGPLIAGLLLQADILGLGWRPIFLMNLPLGLLALAGVWVLQRESRSPHPLRLDLPGVALATLALLLVLYPLVQGRELGWPAWTFGALVAALPAFAAFALYERRKARVDGSPLVPLDLFRQPAFVSGLLVALCLFAGITAFFLVYSLLAQVGLGLTALETGLTALPWPLGIAIASGASIRLAPTIGRRLLSAGTLLLAAGMGGLILALGLAGVDVTPWHLVPGLLLGGLGMGMVAPTLTDFVLAGVPERDAGAASGVLNTIMQVGGAAGVALAGTLFFGLLTSQAGPSAEAVAPRLRADLTAVGVPAPAQERILADFGRCAAAFGAAGDPSGLPADCPQGEEPAAPRVAEALQAAGDQARRQVFVTSAERVFWGQVVVFLLSFLLMFRLPRKPLRHDPATEA